MSEITHTSRTLIACGLALALVGCVDRDREAPTGLRPGGPHYTQVASAPVVNTLTDDDYNATPQCTDTYCTLRSAIRFAEAGATITFAPALNGGTIYLTQGNAWFNKNTTIVGPGAGSLRVNSGNGETVFHVTGGATVDISGLTISGSWSTSALSVQVGATLNVAQCVVRDANTHAEFSSAGALTNSGTANFVETAIIGNSSASAGAPGAIYNLGTLSLVRSTISGNSTAGQGGAIYNGHEFDGTYHFGVVNLTNSTISGNSAGGHGGAIYNSGILNVMNSTIVGNATTGAGGGIYQVRTMTVTNSLIALNMDGGLGPDIYQGLSTNTITYNLIGSATGHSWTNGVNGNIVGVAEADLHLGALADNGGPTYTHALLTGSPAINAGTSSGCPSTDQRGVTRPQGAACDIGAYEKEGTTLITPSFTFNLATLPAKTFGDGSFSVTSYASTNSAGVISYALGAGSAGCSVSMAGLVTISGATGGGSCLIEASLASDGTYAAAGPISQSFGIAKAAGSVTINNIPSSATVGGSFTPSYTKSGDGTASVSSKTTGLCTVDAGVVSFIAAGTCTLQASVTEGTNYLAATGSDQGFTIGLLTPTFTFNLSALPAKTFGDPSFSVAGYATTNSGGAITFALGAGSTGCTVSSAGLVTISGATGSGSCVIDATLAASGSYTGAGPTSQAFSIAKAAGAVTINNIPASPTVGGRFTPAYTKTGTGSASTSSKTTSVCTVTSGVVNFIATGTCTLQASIAESANYFAATGAEQSFTVDPAPPFSSTCFYTINSKNDQRSVTVTWENAFPGVTLVEIADGRALTKAMAPTTAGTWTTNVKTGIPTYRIWGGTSRKDSSYEWVTAGTCSIPQ